MKRTELQAALQVRFREAGACWNLLNESMKGSAAVATRYNQHPQSNLAGITVLKQADRRLVFKVTGGAGEAALCKAFPFARLKERLRSSKYAFAEAANLSTAFNRRLPVPRLFGFGERRPFLLPQWNAVLMEFVEGESMRELLFTNPSEEVKWRLLLRALPLLEKLHSAGCNHVDFGPHAILLSREGPAGDRIIDFQYASFLRTPNPVMAASQAGYFGWSVAVNRDWVSREMIEAWFEEWFRSMHFTDRDLLTKVFEDAMASRKSIRERLQIGT